jgi:hypothetical protein
MDATTATCQKCDGRGVVHVVGDYSIGFDQCDCQPPEYWAEQSRIRSDKLQQRIDEARKQFGGEVGGEI